MPLALRDRINTGFLAGLMNACCYVGSAVSAYGLGKIADGKSWDFVIRILLISAAAATALAGIVMLLKMVRGRSASQGET
jgi:sugar phosphate permease